MGFCAVGKYHNIEVEDEATLYVRYENGATGTFVTSTGEYPGTNRLEIVGDGGQLVLEKGQLCYTRLLTPEREACFGSREGMPAIPCEESVYTPDSAETAHAGILQNFSDAIRFGTPLLAPGYEGISELTLSNAAYLSAWEGNRWVQLPLDSERFDALLRQRCTASAYRDGVQPETMPEGYSSRWQVNW
jgi:predicted dehydrogenase